MGVSQIPRASDCIARRSPSQARELPAGVRDFSEAENGKEAEVHPPNIELIPFCLERGGMGIGVVIVVQLLTAEPDRDWRDVPALVLHLEVAVSNGVTHTVDDAGRPKRYPDHLDSPDQWADEEP